MQNIIETNASQEITPRASLVRRARVRVASVLAMVAFIVAGGGAAAFADAPTTTDPLQGGGDSIFTTLTSYLQTHLVSEVLGLAVVAIALSLVIKWVRKAVHA